MANNNNNSGNSKRAPFECIALLLQGGGALGAYQAGVYQALSESGLEPNWVAGISIGAINAAIIAGNRPEDRVAKLREFWETVTIDDFEYSPFNMFKNYISHNGMEHQAHNFASAIRCLFLGIPGFFKPHSMNPWLQPKGTLKAMSFYDTKHLKSTLESLVDFDRINSGEMRFNVGAVKVTSGNFTDFDNKQFTITPEHIMASGALPPGFPPVEIDGEYYWDGGLISNTPLQWVVESKVFQDSLIFQVDLWSASGEFPQNMADMFTRQKDIQFSSRTRANTDHFKERHLACHAIAKLLEKLPENMKHLPEVEILKPYANNKVYNLVHLIYHNKAYEGYSKDFEFSRLSMEAHWQSGYRDTLDTLKDPHVLQRPRNQVGLAVFDASRKKKKESEETNLRRAA